ncbi:hypothetical protein EIN_129120 [Entamoeba invadens IP1]|uniref:C2 domain-containing protein n=1 Tax=Entamoeba invadens IP1 TaxID=370355 RepID=L7FMJ0_ENTIV|nr:hypothetical protein EIN_129120 [Entamoeba invadens IP1]ELP91572.1 hypothetical protein EIN_129120 [Entamoeba invadens IP1]|eukprot:XP_004258343.1 hypothetical protein EIN_129120 [Entamoeba invadens IP1]
MEVQVDTVIERGCVIGEPIVGYIRLTLQKPFNITTAYVSLCLHVPNYAIAQHPSLPSNQKFLPLKKIQTITFSFGIFTCLGFPNMTSHEYPPGIFKLPFTFNLPQNFQPTLIVPDLFIVASYSLQGFVISAAQPFTGPQVPLHLLQTKLIQLQDNVLQHPKLLQQQQQQQFMSNELPKIDPDDFSQDLELPSVPMTVGTDFTNAMKMEDKHLSIKPEVTPTVTPRPNRQEMDNLIENPPKMLGASLCSFTTSKEMYAQGEVINAKISVRSLKSLTPTLTIGLYGFLIHETVIASKCYTKLTLQESSEDYTQNLQIEIPPIVPPTFTSLFLRWEYFIIISIPPQKVQSSSIYVPVTIKAPFVSLDTLALYSTSLGVKTPNEPFSIHDKIPFFINEENGIERGKSVDGKTVVLNHVERTAGFEQDFEENTQTILYPCYTSITLPPGFSFGRYQNRATVIDHINGIVYWKFQFQNQRVPQSMVSGLRDIPVLQITVLDTFGLNVISKGMIPSYFCQVRGDDGNWIKSVVVKGIDPELNFEFNLRPSVTRQNVVLYFYTKKKFGGKKYIGFIDIDLCETPFNTFVEKLYPIQKSDFGNEPFLGFVRLRIDYNKEETTQSPPKIIRTVFTPTVDVSPNRTPETLHQIQKQNLLRTKFGKNKIYDVLGDTIKINL